MTILFAYDGSESADAAIAAAAGLLGHDGTDAVVLSVWEPLVVQALRAERFGGPIAVPLDAGSEDEETEREAGKVAEHGRGWPGRRGSTHERWHFPTRRASKVRSWPAPMSSTPT